MKRVLRWIVRLAAIVIAVSFVLAVVTVGLTMTEWFMTRCVLPMISNATPYRVTLSGWRFRPWSHVAIKGLVVRQKAHGGMPESTIANVRALNATYSLASLLSAHPVLDSVVIDTPVVGLTSAKAETSPLPGATAPSPAPRPPAPAPVPAPKPAPTSEPKAAERSPTLAAMAIPFTAKSVRISNGDISYEDSAGMRVRVRDMNLTARDLGPEQQGAVDMSATVAFADGKEIAIERLPLAFNAQCQLSKSLVPNTLTANMAVTNVAGVVGALDLRPLASTVNVVVKSQDAKQFHVERAAARIDWLNTMLAQLTVTGAINVSQMIADAAIDAALRPSPLWQALIPAKTGINIADTTADINMRISSRDKGQALTSAGSVRVRDFKVAAPKAGAQTITPMNVDGVFNASVDNRAKTLVVPQLDLTVSQRNAPVIAMRAEEPVTVNWGKNQAAGGANENARIRLDITKLYLPQLNAFLKAGETSINDGELSAALRCDIANRGERIGVQGTIDASNVELRSGKAQWRRLSVKSQIATELAALGLVNVQRLTAETSLNDQPAGQLAAGGYYDIKAGSNRLALAVAKMSSELVRPLLDPNNKNRRLDGLVMTLQSLTQNDDPARKPQDVGIDLRIANSLRRSAQDWDVLQWTAHAAVTPQQAIVDDCKLTLSPAQWTDNEIKLNGTVNLKPSSTPSKVNITSRRFDATVLLDTFLPSKKARAAGVAAPFDLENMYAAATASDATVPRAQRVTAATPAKEPAALDLTGRDLAVNIQIDELAAREMFIQPLYADVNLANSVLSLATRRCYINNGPVDLRGAIDLSQPGFAYNAVLSLTNVPMRPVFNTWVPDKRDMIDGNLVAQYALNGRGVTKPNLARYLRGGGTLRMQNGTLLHAPVLDDIGKFLRYDKLRSFTFGDAVVNSVVSNGVVSIDDARLRSSTISTVIRGMVDFDKRLDMLVYLGLSGSAVVAVSSALGMALPFAKQLGGFYEIPFAIPVRGTLDAPVVAAEYSKFVTEMIKQTGNDPSKLIKNILEHVPDNKVRDQVDKSMKVIEGLFDTIRQPKKP